MSNILSRPNGVGAPVRKCETCRFDGLKWGEEPCHSCMKTGRFNYWEPKEDARPEVHWILCSERLPENDADVLVTTVKPDGAKDVGIGCYDRMSDEWSLCLKESAEVIAWVSLPNPHVG